MPCFKPSDACVKLLSAKRGQAGFPGKEFKEQIGKDRICIARQQEHSSSVALQQGWPKEISDLRSPDCKSLGF